MFGLLAHIQYTHRQQIRLRAARFDPQKAVTQQIAAWVYAHDYFCQN
jgi:hypothetical protein